MWVYFSGRERPTGERAKCSWAHSFKKPHQTHGARQVLLLVAAVMDEEIFPVRHAGCLDILHVALKKLIEQVKINLYSPAREVS